MKKTKILLITLILTSSFTMAQEYETETDTADDYEIKTTDTIISEEESKPSPVENETSVVLQTESPTENKQMLKAGIAKKNMGVALTAVGGLFMGGTLVYTIAFIINPEKLGIPLGGTSSGYTRIDFYLNPGLFGLAVAGPCLAGGIVNMVRGNNLIEDAKRGDEDESSFQLTPYLGYNNRTKTALAGAVVNF